MAHNSTSMSISTTGAGGRSFSGAFDRKSAHRNSSGAGGQRGSGMQRGRGSTESAHSEQTSGRSSFALEAEPALRQTRIVDSVAQQQQQLRKEASGSMSPTAAAARGPPTPAPLTPTELEALCMQMRVPPAMHARFLRLAVLHPNLPVPMQTLVRCSPQSSSQFYTLDPS